MAERDENMNAECLDEQPVKDEVDKADTQDDALSIDEAIKALEEEKNRLMEEQLERYKRLQADFDNFRRRTRQEKEELSQVVTQNIITQMLPVLDNFERALSSSADDKAEGVLAGVQMVYRQFLQVLEKNGLTAIEALGTEFDPQQHEAVMRVEDNDKPDGTVLEELQKGYKVYGKVIRPSMVKVVGN